MTRPVFLRVPERSSYFILTRLALFVFLLCAYDTAAQSADRQSYDIPALAVDRALSRFSEISRIDVLLREPAADQSRSKPVQGTFSPAEALRIMLEGSGLVTRFTSSRSVIIVSEERATAQWRAPSVSGRGNASGVMLNLDMMRVTAPRVIGQARIGQKNTGFAKQLAVRIRSYVTKNELIKGGKTANLRLATRISTEGTLFDVKVLRSIHHPELDRRIARALEGASLALPPPVDLPQPLIFDISGR